MGNVPMTLTYPFQRSPHCSDTVNLRHLKPSYDMVKTANIQAARNKPAINMYVNGEFTLILTGQFRTNFGSFDAAISWQRNSTMFTSMPRIRTWVSVVSVCYFVRFLSARTGWKHGPIQTWGPPLPVQTFSLGNAEGWPSTERPSW